MKRFFIIGLGWAFALLSAWPAHADKIIYINGKILEGVIQEEQPSRIKFLYQDRLIVIPRDRIEEIQRDSDRSNIELLLQRAEAALRAGNADEAEGLIEKAKQLDKGKNAFTEDIQRLEGYVLQVRAEGSLDENKNAARLLVDEALEHFDRIEIQKGLEKLFSALEVDPDNERAHREMSEFMQRNRPVQMSVAIAYFTEHVDPDRLDANHAVVAMLPEMLERLFVQLQNARDAAEVKQITERLNKVAEALQDRSEFRETATTAQQTLIQMGAEGMFATIVEEKLRRGDYAGALMRLRAWAPPEANPTVAQLYTRALTGAGNLEEARSVLRDIQARAPGVNWIERSLNSLDLYQRAVEAVQAGRNSEAQAILERLYSVREGLLPEIFNLVVESKVNFDLSDMRQAEAQGDATTAAAKAFMIYLDAPNQQIRQAAAQTFRRTAPLMAYRLNFEMVVDGITIPLHDESNQIVRRALAERFGINFSNESPFVLNVRVLAGTVNGSGSMVLEATKKEQPYELDYIEPDDSITNLTIEVSAAHESGRTLYFTSVQNPPLAQNPQQGYDAQGVPVYSNLNQLSFIDTFLAGDFGAYLPPELATVGSHLQLPRPTG